jgi:hypothetical protein
MRRLVLIVILASSSTSFAQTKPATNDAAIKNTVEHCVEEVHQLGNKDFDAYYNAGTNKVENNITNSWQEWALYPFRKCMAKHGLPLQ